MAEADAIRARMEAEALGIERRAAALSQNQEAVIAQQIAENLPEIVRAAASSFEHVGNFTVLNGAAGRDRRAGRDHPAGRRAVRHGARGADAEARRSVERPQSSTRTVPRPRHPEPAATAARPGRRVRVNAAAAGSSDVSGTNGAADLEKGNEEAPGEPVDGPEPAPEAAH